MVPFVFCRNQVTGAEAEVPETALPHFSDWIPTDRPEPDPVGDTSLADDNATATEPEPATGTRRTPRSKPADPATDKKEL
jgi:hypothetical protein